MNNQTTNQKLKRLMQDYEIGALNYDTYRQRRNSIIDEYAGVEERLSSNNIMHKPADTQQEKVSPYRAIFTLGLVLLAVVITYVAIKDDNGGKALDMKDQFVDSRQLPENTKGGTSP